MTTRNLALKIGLVAALALPVMAEDVTFTTSGSFSCGTAVGCSVSPDGTTITYNNNGTIATDKAIGFTYTNLPAGNDPSISDVNVIEFDDAVNGNGTGALTNGSTFTFKVTQTSPTAGSQTLSGSLSGTIFSSNTSSTIDFGGNTTIVLGNITYTLDSSTWPMANTGFGTGQAVFTAQVTPEPTFMLLTGVGFSGLAFMAWRRKRTA